MEPSDSSQPEDYSGFVDTQDKGRNYLFYIVIIVFVLILVGYFAMQSPDQEIELDAPLSQAGTESVKPHQPTPAELAERQASSAVQPLGTKESPRVPEAQTTQTAMLTPATSTEATAQTESRPGEAARAVIDSMRQGDKDITLEQLYEQAVLHQKRDESTDAYLLYFFAARKGHGPAALELAKMHDPAHFEAGSDMLDKPDLTQAYKWYSKAVENGVGEAEQSLQALRSSIEAAAKQGDVNAQRLLLNWK